MAIKFIILYFCNLVLDYPLQDSFLKEWKSKNNYILFVHSAIWSLGISIALLYLGLFRWWKVGMLLIGHFVIDYWKCHRLYLRKELRTGDIGKKNFSRLYLKKELRTGDIGKRDFRALYIDQTLHVIQILLCLL